jgi:hypothetical protein
MSHSPHDPDEDTCPQCQGCYCDSCVARMKDTEIDLLWNDICPYCRFDLLRGEVEYAKINR